MRHHVSLLAGTVGIVTLLASAGTLTAETALEKITRELQGEFNDAGKRIFAKIVTVVEGNLKAIREAHAAALKKRDDRLGKLEKDHVAALKERDDRLGKLETELKKVREALATKDRQLGELKDKVAAASAKKKNGKGQADLTGAFIGVTHVEPSAAVREKLKLQPGQGAQIVSVYPGGPAEKAGIKEGDIVIAIGDHDVDSKSLEKTVRGFKPGTKISLSLRRGDEKISSEVSLGERGQYLAGLEKGAEKKAKKKAVVAKKADKPAVAKKVKARLGILVEETDDKSLLVREVEKGHTGAVAKLASGDQIVAINGKKVGTLEDLRGSVTGIHVGDTIRFDLKRGNETITVEVVAGSKEGEAKLVGISQVKSFKGQPAVLGVRVEEVDGKVTVQAVTADTAAGAFGVVAKDVLVEVNKKPVKTIDDVKALLAGKVSGDSIDMVLLRGDKQVSIAGMVLGARGEKITVPEGYKPAIASAVAAKPTPKPKERGYLGLTAQELDDDTVKVSAVVGDGPAAAAKLQKNDVIVKVNEVAVKTLDDVVRGMKESFVGDSVTIVVRRGDKDVEVKITLEKLPG